MRPRWIVALGLAACLALPAPLSAQTPYVDPMTPAGRTSLARLDERVRHGDLGRDVTSATISPLYWYTGGAMHIELAQRDGRHFGYFLLPAPRAAVVGGRRRDFGLFAEDARGIPHIARLSATLDGLFVESPWVARRLPTLGVVGRPRAYLAVYFLLATALPGLLYLLLARPRGLTS
ncbi:MAG: hypothetical protein JWM10_3311 [Myxococcaceae bacterium]|nr:hypothetical protein [Myxococcaceae bacterium]